MYSGGIHDPELGKNLVVIFDEGFYNMMMLSMMERGGEGERERVNEKGGMSVLFVGGLFCFFLVVLNSLSLPPSLSFGFKKVHPGGVEGEGVCGIDWFVVVLGPG